MQIYLPQTSRPQTTLYLHRAEAHSGNCVTTQEQGPTSTTGDVLAGIDLQGKRIFVPGLRPDWKLRLRARLRMSCAGRWRGNGHEKGRSGECIGAQRKCEPKPGWDFDYEGLWPLLV